jgi:hypothetical protein
MKHAGTGVVKFGEKVSHTGRRIAAFAAGIAAAAAGGGLVLLTKRAFENVDALTKQADKLGLSTEHLVGLQHAAKLSGIEVNTANMAIQRMVRRMSEAAQGTGEAKDALKELGVDAKVLGKLDTRSQLYAIADALDRVQNSGDRVRLAFKLFDSEGVAMVNMLRGGSAALEEFQADAERLGITFSRIDADKIVRANDAIERMRVVVHGAAQVFAAQLAPFIEHVANELVFTASAGNDMGKSVVNAFDHILNAIGRTADHLELLRGMWRVNQIAAAAALATFMTGLEVIDRGLTKLFDAMLIPSGGYNRTIAGWAQALREETHAAGKAADEAFARFYAKDHSRNIDLFFKQIRAEAERTGRTISEALGDLPDMTKKLGRQALSRQVSTRLDYFITTLGKPAQAPSAQAKPIAIKSPTLLEIRDTLKLMLLEMGKAAVTS